MENWTSMDCVTMAVQALPIQVLALAVLALVNFTQAGSLLTTLEMCLKVAGMDLRMLLSEVPHKPFMREKAPQASVARMLKR
jgi:hypothetical protein